MRVLIIEDDDRIALPLKEDLERQHNFVEIASDGKSGLERGLTALFDVIVLDLMLPQMDGMEVCTRLRQAGCRTAIIMTTARRKITDKIQGLDCGADDYLAKPFDIEELSARIRAVLRRGNESRQPILTFDNLSMNTNTHEVKHLFAVLDLTPIEYKMLEHFLSNPSRVYTKEELINKLWPSDQSPTSYVIKTHIKGLRKKLSAVGASEDIVQTVYGVGYRLKENA